MTRPKRVEMSEEEVKEAQRVLAMLTELNTSDLYQDFNELPEAVGASVLAISNLLFRYKHRESF